MINEISCQELKMKIDRKDEFKLVNCLEAAKFRAMHIPGSLNIYQKEDIVYQKEDIQMLLSVNDVIVVYCTDEACNKSILLYRLLEEYEYKNISRFAGGLRRWEADGYALVGEMVN